MLKERINFISDCIFRLNDETKLMIVNEYNDCMGNNRIYMNVEYGLEELAGGLSIDAVFRAISYGDYNYLDKFVKANEYGNFVSMNCIDTDLDSVAMWMIENAHCDAKDAWDILNASTFAESGTYIEDIADELGYLFTINDFEMLREWFDEECYDKTISDLVLTSWYDIYNRYMQWVARKEN